MFLFLLVLIAISQAILLIPPIMVCYMLMRLDDNADAAGLKAGEPRAHRRAYEPVVDPSLLAILFGCLFFMLVFYTGLHILLDRVFGIPLPNSVSSYGSEIGAFVVTFLVPLLIYYSLLPLFLPLMKKRYRPSTLTTLWILPNILCILICFGGGIRGIGLRYWVLRLKESWLWILFVIWLAGFCFLLGRNIYSHLHFRKELLGQARLWEDPDIQEKWRGLKEEYHLKKRFILPPLYRSPAIASPLTIGLNVRKSYVILPEKDYTEEELDMILRHELIHLIHNDPWAKFHICLIQALMWFNPLIRISCRSFSEDLERSCDALVLGDATPEARSLYVNLLLKNAADTRGFSTCLSASAISIKNRMGEVLHPVKRKRGLLLILMLTLALILSAGRVMVAYGEERSLGERVESILQDPADLEIYCTEKQTERNIGPFVTSYYNTDDKTTYLCRDTEAVLEALRGLKVCPVLGFWDHGDSPVLSILDPSDQSNSIQISRQCLRISSKEYYYLEEGEWERFMSIIEELSEG